MKPVLVGVFLLLAAWPAVSDKPLNELLNAQRAELACATSDAERLEARHRLADTYRQHGRHRLALLELDMARSIAATPADAAALQARRGGLLLEIGQPTEALQPLTLAFDRRDELEPMVRLQLYNDLATALAATRQYDEAADLFVQTRDLAVSTADAEAAARAALNHVRARMDDRNLDGLDDRLGGARRDVERVADASTRAALLVTLADLHRLAVDEFGYGADVLEQARIMLHSALELTRADDVLGYAHGFLGGIEASAGEPELALQHTERAIHYARRNELLEQAYRWEWQSGRILRGLEHQPEALAAFERAVFLLDRLRSTSGSLPDFQRLIAPVYLEYADALLQGAEELPTGQLRQASLRSTRGLLESLKQAEVEDYFATSCLPRNDAAGEPRREVAVLYPVLLETRTVLLLELAGQLHQLVVPAGRNEITSVVRRFRVAVERPSSGDDYLQHAQQLYRWLIGPTLPLLQEQSVETLVIVPDGALRTIPLAALHDGNQFLIQLFALATTPAVRLTESGGSRGGQMLAGGVSESVQGFPALPKVAAEVQQIGRSFAAQPLLDSGFTLTALSQGLSRPEYGLAHLATHGEFKSDHRQSFLLTYDDRLTLERMQSLLRARAGEPLDLLVLSACRTAAGDDRAALGLAGVAVQSGARSVLASLWYVSDTATAELVERFYAELGRTGSKAQSLRRAQLHLLESERFRHPSFWAPYLLIGSWS